MDHSKLNNPFRVGLRKPPNVRDWAEQGRAFIAANDKIFSLRVSADAKLYVDDPGHRTDSRMGEIGIGIASQIAAARRFCSLHGKQEETADRVVAHVPKIEFLARDPDVIYRLIIHQCEKSDEASCTEAADKVIDWLAEVVPELKEYVAKARMNRGVQHAPVDVHPREPSLGNYTPAAHSPVSMEEAVQCTKTQGQTAKAREQQIRRRVARAEKLGIVDPLFKRLPPPPGMQRPGMEFARDHFEQGLRAENKQERPTRRGRKPQTVWPQVAVANVQ